LSDDPLFWFAVGTTKYVPVLSYPQAKTFRVLRQAGDSFGLLCKLQGSRGKALPERHLFGSLYLVNKPTNLGS
jgi:hypothetical protein